MYQNEDSAVFLLRSLKHLEKSEYNPHLEF